MSSFKNSKPHRKYRERAQPEAREHLGLLEKKKDYRQRAKNFHEKEDRIRQLRLKAAMANPDQFYHRMEKGKHKDGQHIEFDSDESEIDERQYKRELKKQNQTIVTMQHSIEANKAQRLRGQLHLLDKAKPKIHKIFVESEQQVNNFDGDQLPSEQVPEMSSTVKEKYNKLSEIEKKQQKMKKMMLKLQFQRNMLTKERRRIKKCKDGSKYRKFFMQRKR